MEPTRRRIVLRRKLVPTAAWLILASLIVLQLAVPATASGPDGTIKGYVTDRATGFPVSGAFVRVEPNNLPWFYELSTDASGYFEVSAVPQAYNFIVLHSDYRFYQVSIGVGSLQTTWANASLDWAAPRTARLVGYANDTSTGAPVTVGRIVAVPQLPPFDYVNISYFDGITGSYAMDLVPGSYNLFTDSVVGYFGFGTSVTLGDGQVLWLNISLSPNPFNADITGTAYDASTLAPLAGVTVSVDVDDLFLPGVVTDASGGFTISVPSGFATVTGNLVGYGPDTQTVFVASMTSNTVDLYLRPILASIRGYVTDESTGLAIPNATVSAADSLGYYEQVSSNETGYFEIPVPEGSLNLEASAPGYSPNSTGLFLNEGETVWSNVSLVPLPPIVATVQGYVVDASSGSHVPGMTVAVFDVFTGFSNVTVADGTGFYFLGVIESDFLIALVPAGGGYAGGQTFTSAAPGDVVWTNITIYPLNATVRVHATDALTGMPIAGAFVSLTWGFTYSTTNNTDGSGYADLPSPATTDVGLSVSAGGYYADSRTMIVAPGLNLVDIALYPALPFDVHVLGYITENGTGNPIAGAQVAASGYPNSSTLNFTDPSGYFELWIVASPQLIRATSPGYASNETSISPSSGDTIVVNLTLDFDPVPPQFVAFTATPDVGVSPANPTALVADILEKKLDPDNTMMTLLRLMSVTGPDGTFLAIGSVDPADLVIAQPASGEYTVSTSWDARTAGGWVQNASTTEWWPSMPGFFPDTDGVLGYWYNGTIPSPDFSMAMFNRASGDLALVFSFTYGIITPADQATSTFTPAGSGLTINLGTGQILGSAPIFGSAFELAGLRFVYDDVVPSGSYAAFLQVVDSAGNWNYSVALFDVDVTPPVANAGADQTVDEDTTVTFDGSGSTDNAGIVDYTWTFTDGTPQTLTGPSPTYVFANPGAYVVTLIVRDAGGSTATDSMTVTVRDVTAPIAFAGPDQTVDEDTVVAFDGSGSTDNVAVTSYTWTFTDGTVRTLSGSAPSYTFATPGVYVVTLTVGDGAGNGASDTVTVTVRDVTSPGASAGPDQTVDEDATATLSGAGSTDNVGVANYTWAFTDGSPRTLYGSSATYVFATPGVYTVTLTVRDAAGNAAADTLTVTVRDVTLPAASIDSPASEATVSGTLVIGVTASDNVGVARVELRLDGALVATDTTAPYSFSLSTGNYSDGTHTLRVTAYDAAGNRFSTDRTVTFSNPRPPQGLGFVEYGGIVLLMLGAAAVAWLIFRRGKRRKPTNMPPPSETSPPDELDVESHGQP